MGCGMSWAQQNVIQAENAKPGTTEWQLTASSSTPTVEGYASHTSVNRGETIQFFVSSAAPSYRMDIYRMGWYGGAGGRLMHSASLQGVKQPTPQPDPVTGLVECNWVESYRLTIPQTADKTDWATGIYLAKLTPSSGTQSYMIFVVRDDTSRSTYLHQTTPTTWQAYNGWGGRSLYAFTSEGNAQARKVSFNRPYAQDMSADYTRFWPEKWFLPYQGNWPGAGFFLNWEIYFIRFIEREGYDVSYVSNLDLHTNGSQLLNHRALLIAGHDEYWSYQMKSAAHAAQAQGVHFGFFAANEAYWQVRFEPSATGQPNRTMVGYKEAAQSQDPLALDRDSSNDKYITTRFRDLKPVFGVNDSVAQPENGLVGVMYHGDPFDGDIVVSDASSWVYSGSGVSNGTGFTGLLGYETDTIASNGYSPPQLRKIADSPDSWGGSHMATYTTPSGSIVFATGSMQWNWGLDNLFSHDHENAAVKLATRNVLARFAAPPLRTPTNVQAIGADQSINLNWTAPTGATSFNVYRSQASDGQGTAPYQTGLMTPSFSDTGLSNGSTYYYRVSAANVITESAQSAEVSAAAGGSTPPPPPPPAPVPVPPTSLQAALAGKNIKLAWTQSPSAGVTGNKVYRAPSATGPFSLLVSLPASTSFTDSSVARKSTYHYVVTAVSSGGESSYSNTASETSK